MKIFIDFDDVLFNTKKFKEKLADIFASVGISKEEYEKTYFKPRDEHSVKVHDIEEQIQRLKGVCSFDEEELRKLLDNLMQDTSSFIFDDVVPFANANKGDELAILSFGSKDFQKKKVASSGIQKYIAEIIVAGESKAETLADIFKNQSDILNEKILFIDDRTEQIQDVKKNFPGIITIFIKRPEGRYQYMEKDEYCDFEAHNLEEVQKIVERLS